ncbi:MAG: hypothetical protein OXB93_06425, partial [Cytophagales bacterium]|nr:hypothetical protein [Cytophagales bacterium]
MTETGFQKRLQGLQHNMEGWTQRAQSLIQDLKKYDQKIQELEDNLREYGKKVQELNRHADLYYKGGDHAPLLEDEEYDKRLIAIKGFEKDFFELVQGFLKDLAGSFRDAQEGFSQSQKALQEVDKDLRVLKESGDFQVVREDFLKNLEQLPQKQEAFRNIREGVLKKKESLLGMQKDFERLYKDSPTQVVGDDLTGQFHSYPHKFPMLSLKNTYTREDLDEFEIQLRKKLGEERIEYYCEPKFDGVAINMIYVRGEFHRALARGDGREGEDLSANIRTLRDIPMKIAGACPAYMEIRGEVFIARERFLDLNRQRIREDEKPWANPRNMAAGTLKLK